MKEISFPKRFRIRVRLTCHESEALSHPSKNYLRQKNPANYFRWANSEGHPHTEGAFTGTLVNVGHLCRNFGECRGGSREYGDLGSPKFARVRQSLHEGAHMLLVHPGPA